MDLSQLLDERYGPPTSSAERRAELLRHVGTFPPASQLLLLTYFPSESALYDHLRDQQWVHHDHALPHIQATSVRRWNEYTASVERHVRDSLAAPVASTIFGTCRRCRSSRLFVTTRQLRRADEGMTARGRANAAAGPRRRDPTVSGLRARDQDQQLITVKGCRTGEGANNAMDQAELVWQRFGAFADTACRNARQQLAAADTVTSAFMSLASVPSPAAGSAALCNYFQVPAHIGAVNNLDHNQFVNDLAFGPQGPTVPLRVILEEFSRVGPRAHGEVWLSLLDVADAANPADIRTAGCRVFIAQQMQKQPSTTENRVVPSDQPAIQMSMPHPAQLDNILGSVLTAFPGLQQCVSSLMSNPNGATSEAELGRVIDSVQNTLLDPIVQSIQQSNPNAKGAGEAIDMIMRGFKTLTSTMAANSNGAADQQQQQGNMETAS